LFYLDEPFAGVDPIAVEENQGIVSKLKRKNIGMIVSDHNVDQTLAITDRAYLMVEGNCSKQKRHKSWLMIRWCAKYI